MVFLYFLSFFCYINSRIYERIYNVQKKVIQNIHQLSLEFHIQGTNDYIYHFKSQDIFFNFDAIFMNEYKKEFWAYDQYIKILFNLKIYEYHPRIFDYSSKDIIYSEDMLADIKFKFFKFYEEYDDFSFGFQSNISNIDNNIIIHFENIDKLNNFKYILFEEKNVLYNNKTLSHFIKLNIAKNINDEIRKSLVYYPECDSLYYFQSIINYFTNELFYLDYPINSLFTINKCKISSFNYDKIIKDDRNIILTKINASMYLEFFVDNYEKTSTEFYEEENLFLIVDNITIDQNKNIIYGKQKNNKEYSLDALKLIINKTEEILEKETI